ncbi:hypothetical protein EMCRGX_G026383 [Ephydatia muelleri]
MKSLGRSFVWWPNMDADVEERVKRCEVCQKVPAAAPFHPWEWPKLPWCRLHADYAGPFMGKMILLIMDAHSKWLEAHIVESSATSAATIQKMKASFASHGLPVTLVTDNGSIFTSQEFEYFLTKNNNEVGFEERCRKGSGKLLDEVPFQEAMFIHIHDPSRCEGDTQDLVQEKVRATLERQKWHDKRAKPCSFIIGDQVLVLNLNGYLVKSPISEVLSQ